MPDRQPALTRTVTTTTGTGPYTLSIAPLPSGDSRRTPRQAFLDGNLASGDTVFYMCRDTTLGNDDDKFFEYGIGIYTDATNTVTRGTILQSSDSNVAVDWGSGQRDFYLTTVPDPARLSGANIFTQDQRIEKTDAAWIAEAVSGSEFRFEDEDATFANITKESSAGSSVIALHPKPLNNTSASLMRLFQATDTSGSRILQIFKGDGTGAITCSINAAAGTAEFEGLQSSDGNPYEHFDSGTAMVFYQASPPTGWTQDASSNEAALRVVSGSGGGTGGSIALTGSSVSGGHAISVGQMPSHDHGPNGGNGSTTWATFDVGSGSFAYSTEAGGVTILSETKTDTTGGSGSHDHGIGLKFIDVIVATKD